MDPATANLGTKILTAIKEWPVWILFAIALSLTVILAVPYLQAAVPISAALLICAAVVAWIFFIARATQPTVAAIMGYLQRREQKHFFISPIEQQCDCGISKQPDGSYITQFSAHCLIKNRSRELLYPTNARIVRPRIRGEVIPNPTIFIEGHDRRTYGSAGMSGNYIPRGATRPVSCIIMIRGRPRQKFGAIFATIEINDADGHRQRVKARFQYVGA
jgi:hypothetical protein